MSRRALGALLLLLAACGGPNGKDKAAREPAARVDHTVRESDLNTVRLAPDTEARLGIEVAPVERRSLPSVRLVPGEVVVPPGLSVEVTAPVAGTLEPPAEGESPRAGMRVRKGQPVGRLVPLLAGDRGLRSSALRDVDSARAALEAAEKGEARASELLRTGSGSRRGLEEAHADAVRARAEMDAATERLASVERGPARGGDDLVVLAPIDGRVDDVSVAPGQTVAASARLLRIVQVDRLWVRVPLYAGEVDRLDLSLGADVSRLGDAPDAPRVRASLVEAPPSADPAASAVHAVFALPAGAPFRPGERVLGRLTGRSRGEAPVVAAGALLHDVHGGAWVYEQTAPHEFARRRVEVENLVGDVAVLARGPDSGALVVTVGAAELYGIEFGAGK
jgi:RND family efflux transporter MFP subunit